MKYKSIRKRVRRRKPEALDVDNFITRHPGYPSCFPIKSYNSSGVIFNVPKGIKLPFQNKTIKYPE